MKKILIITILLFQMTFVFGQENKWGPWNNSDCYPKIQFRAKLVSKQYYTGGSSSSDGCNTEQGYQWRVQVKNNYSKRVLVYFSGGNKSCVEKNMSDGRDLNIASSEVGEINLKDWYSNSTTGIFVLIKALAFLNSKDDDSYQNDPALQYEKCLNGSLCQLCRININAPHCPKVKISGKVNMNDNGPKNSLNVEQQENILLSNLKLNLKNGQYNMTFKGGGNGLMYIKNIEVNSEPALWWKQGYGDQGNPHTLYVHYKYNQEGSGSLDEQWYIISEFKELAVEKINFGGENLLSFYNHRNPMIYNFGANDENFIELQKAIEALKNPNKNFGGANKQSGNVQKTQENSTSNSSTQKTNIKHSVSEEKPISSMPNNTASKNSLITSNLSASQLFQKAKQLVNKGEFIKAFDYYEAAAKKDNVKAMEMCAAYFDGFHLDKDKPFFEEDYTKAEYWLKKAAEKGSINSSYRLGFFYSDSDKQKAYECFKVAAVKGNSYAMYYIGKLFESGGSNMEKDLVKAKQWYKKACKAGNSTGCESAKKI